MIVFDLDGTLANIEHRRHWVDKSVRGNKTDWHKFFAECVNDTPIEPMCNLFRTLHKVNAKTMEIWSGRSEEVYWDTVAWLNKHLFEGYDGWTIPASTFYVKLQMRPIGDTCPDVMLKERMLDAAIHSGKEIEFVVDDRQGVVNMWRRRGILCLQCAEGDY